MKVHQGLDNFVKLPFAVVTSGTFDGVHIGHQKILNRLRETAKQYRGETVVITYWPHPRLIVSTDSADLKLLSTIDEKIELLAKYSVDHLVIIPFTKEFSQLTSEQFITSILVEKIGTKKLVIGYDHRFGKNREGSFEHLQQNSSRYGFEVEEIPRQDIEDVGVSSSRIRTALSTGHVHIANEYLGNMYSITGKVVHGDKLGRTIGFPTANVEVAESYKLIPMDGIYAARILCHNNIFNGMLYIGTRPTLESKIRTIEVHIFDFDEDIYNETITIFFAELIREDEKFSDIAALQEKLHSDRERAIAILSGIHK
jgi:riboflavin kinase / FMN adenylyltransferase